MKKIRHAHVRANEVTFSLPTFPTLGVKCTLKEGKPVISHCEYHRKASCIDIPEIINAESKQKRNTIILYVLMGLLGLTIKSHFNTYALLSTVALIIFDITVNKNAIAEFFLYIVNFNKNKRNKQAKSLHTAMHIGINAFNTLKRAPKDEKEFKRFSQYSANCSYAKRAISVFSTIVIWLFACIVPKGRRTIVKIGFILIFIAVLITVRYIADYLKTQKAAYKYFAIFSLKKPTLDEIELVITALKEVERIENNQEEFEKLCENKSLPFEYQKCSFGYVEKGYFESH